MLAVKGTPRRDEVGLAKDRADLEAMRSVAEILIAEGHFGH
jgi:hypothetical protein